jgi:hypothetical protein
MKVVPAVRGINTRRLGHYTSVSKKKEKTEKKLRFSSALKYVMYEIQLNST